VRIACAAVAALAGLTGCATSAPSPAPQSVATPARQPTAAASPPSPAAAVPSPAASSPRPALLPRPGNPAGRAEVPAAGRLADTTRPTRVIGNGTPVSCTSAAVVSAVAAGGIVTFSCGPAPVTITMRATAKVRNANARLVLDGGGKVTLSGGGKRRILYQNTCDAAQGLTTSHCQDQDKPTLTVQNLTFADGNSAGQRAEGGGGGAIFARGGRLTVVNSRFVRNRCDGSGPDLGGAAIRVLSQRRSVHVVGSTFGGAAGQGGRCSNGGALSSIGVSWTILNCVFSHNAAIGRGANPAQPGTPGGGSGGAIYADGNAFTVLIAGTRVQDNRANEGGGAVFFVSNNRTGTLQIRDSAWRRNRSGRFESPGLPGIFFLGARSPAINGTALRR
jgi:hypothetical protein